MFKGYSFPSSIILHAVYLKLRFSLSYRDIEELFQIRGVEVDHASIQRWVVKFAPMLEEKFRKRKKTVGKRWRMDETYIKAKGQWMYLYRAVDKNGHTIDFLLTRQRDTKAAKAFLVKAIDQNGLPELINIDKSGANQAGIELYNNLKQTHIESRSAKYLNNIVEQDYRFIKRRVRPMLGFKSIESAESTLAGIELMRMIKKDQMKNPKSTSFQSFCSLAA